MVAVQRIRENLEDVKRALVKRPGFDNTLLEKAISLDDNRRKNQVKMDEALATMNRLSKEIGQLFKQGKTEEANLIKAQTTEAKEQAKALELVQKEIEQELFEIMLNIPNIPNDLVPVGKDDTDNEFIRGWGEKPELTESKLPHWDIGKKFDLFDLELGVKLTGAGFPVYKNQGARLQRGLINFFLAKAAESGYTEYIPPLLVNEDSARGTGQLPDKEAQMYEMKEDPYFLIPTAEVPITNIYRDSLLTENDFPIKLCGHTACFRREAGSYGKEVRGLNRVHQFDKVEIVHIVKPEDSYNELERMIEYVETLLQALELPYRIVRLCGGDLGVASAMTYDFEVWSAAQEMWLEVSSVSNFEDFQANRLNLRYKDGNKKKHKCHTLNGSALALPRIMAALLENNQKENEIVLPKALHKFIGEKLSL